MDSVVSLPRHTGSPTSRVRRSLRGRLQRARALAVPTVVAALPFMAMAALAHGALFVSNSHATTTAKALLAIDRGRLEFLGFTYPPLPFLLALPKPTPLLLAFEGALFGGATVVALWHALDHGEVPRWMRGAVVLAAVGSPAYVFLATQQVGDVAAMLLVLWAWAGFQRFIFEDRTTTGFAAGLLLGTAFYFSFTAMVYAVLIAALTPAYLSMRRAREDRGAETLARAWAVLFPTLVALGSWTYLNWLFRGDALGFLNDPAIPFRALEAVDPGAERGIWAVLRMTAGDLAMTPMYGAVAVIVARAHRRALIPYLAPAALIAGLHMAGLTYSEAFAVSALGLVAVVALRWVPLSRAGAALLLVAAAGQVVVGLTVPLQTPEIRLWQDLASSGERRPLDVLEAQIADQLRHAPARSILTDDRSAYRLVSRVGSARPFLLPADADFTIGLSAPRERVRYVLVSLGGVAVGDEVARRYVHTAPAGFELDTTWHGWRLYRRTDAPRLLGGPRRGEPDTIGDEG